MKGEQLLAIYDRIKDTPEAVPRLRKFVLDLAVRGELGTQNPIDEPASQLVAQIDAEIQRLRVKGHLKKHKTPAKIDEPPFDVPTNWCWSRIREVTSDRGQKVPNEPFSYIDVSSIDKERGKISTLRVLTPKEAPKRARKRVSRGDVIYSCTRPYLLNIAIIDEEIYPEPIVSTAFAVLNGHGLLATRYLWLALRSPFMVQQVMERQRGQAYPAINDTAFATLLLPVPPLAEQQRIVEKNDQLMTLCDDIEETKSHKEKLRDRLTRVSLGRLNKNGVDSNTFRAHARFAIHVLPELTMREAQIRHLRQAILDLAVRGRLVAQNLNDEPATKLLERMEREKTKLVESGQIKKPRAFADEDGRERPFIIPSNWIWCCLHRVGAIIGGGTPDTSNRSFFAPSGKGIPWLTPADLGNHRQLYINRGSRDLTEDGLQNSSATLVPAGTVLFTCRAPIGYVAIASNAVATNQGFKSVVPIIQKCSRFIALVLQAFAGEIDANAPGTTFRELSGKRVAAILIPVPPLAEQHRIVERVDSLLALCDSLESKLKVRREQQINLHESAFHHVLNPIS